jgi:hypothetical protein
MTKKLKINYLVFILESYLILYLMFKMSTSHLCIFDITICFFALVDIMSYFDELFFESIFKNKRLTSL